MRDGLADIVSGWMLIDDFDDLTIRIEQAADWTAVYGPLEPDEEATIKLMIEAQVARGIRRGDFEPHIPRDAQFSLSGRTLEGPRTPLEEVIAEVESYVREGDLITALGDTPAVALAAAYRMFIASAQKD